MSAKTNRKLPVILQINLSCQGTQLPQKTNDTNDARKPNLQMAVTEELIGIMPCFRFVRPGSESVFGQVQPFTALLELPVFLKGLIEGNHNDGAPTR